MHLTDQQLLEIDVLDEHHLSQCKDCQQRATNISQIRQKLNQLPSKTLANKNWQELKSTYQARNEQIKPTLNKKRSNFWMVSSLALAASLILAIVLPQIPSIGELNQHQQLVMLIKQNNLLQQQLIDTKFEFSTKSTNKNFLQYRLSVLDESIQRAQIEKKSDKEKSDLWRSRHELLKHWLTQESSSNTLRI